MDDAAGRFTMVEAPALPPGRCWVTRTDKGPFIDTGTTVEFGEFGRLYISVEAIREMAQVAGLFDEGMSISKRFKEIEWEQRGYDKATKENIGGNLRELVDRLDSVADRIAGVPFVVDAPAPSPVATPDAPDAGNDDDAEPTVFVTDGPDHAVDAAGADESPEAAHGLDGQSDGAADDERPVSIQIGRAHV